MEPASRIFVICASPGGRSISQVGVFGLLLVITFLNRNLLLLFPEDHLYILDSGLAAPRPGAAAFQVEDKRRYLGLCVFELA